MKNLRLIILFVGSCAMINSSGCSYLGIDTRPGIEYVRKGVHEPFSEAMYSREVPGTDFIKRWPKRLGQEYGWAEWEEKPTELQQASNASSKSGVKKQQAKASSTIASKIAPTDTTKLPKKNYRRVGHTAPIDSQTNSPTAARIMQLKQTANAQAKSQATLASQIAPPPPSTDTLPDYPVTKTIIPVVNQPSDDATELLNSFQTESETGNPASSGSSNPLR